MQCNVFKGSKSKITHEHMHFKFCFYTSGMKHGSCSCRLERLALIRESNLKVLSRRHCPKYSHEAMNSNAGAMQQPCTACYTGSGGQHVESPITLILTLTLHCHSIFQ